MDIFIYSKIGRKINSYKIGIFTELSINSLKYPLQTIFTLLMETK